MADVVGEPDSTTPDCLFVFVRVPRYPKTPHGAVSTHSLMGPCVGKHADARRYLLNEFDSLFGPAIPDTVVFVFPIHLAISSAVLG